MHSDTSAAATSAIPTMGDEILQTAIGGSVWRRTAPSFDVPLALVDDPGGWAATARGIAALDALVAEYGWYRRYEPSQSLIDRRTCNQMVTSMLDAVGTGECVEDALRDAVGSGASAWDHFHEVMRSPIESILDAISEQADERDAEFSRDEWMEMLEAALVDRIEEADDSKPQDMLSSHDRAEIVFAFRPQGRTATGGMAIDGGREGLRTFCVDEALQHALSVIGYSIADFRVFSGNRRKPEGLRRGLRKRRIPLISPEQIEHLVDNGCSSDLMFCMYGYVPVSDVMTHVAAETVVLKDFRIAVYNPHSGTFFDGPRIAAATFTTRDGQLAGVSDWHSPDSICGFSMDMMYARIEAPKT